MQAFLHSDRCSDDRCIVVMLFASQQNECAGSVVRLRANAGENHQIVQRKILLDPAYSPSVDKKSLKRTLDASQSYNILIKHKKSRR